MDAQSIDRLRAQFLADLEESRTERDLQAVRDRYVGRKSGAVTALLKSVAGAPPAERPGLGRLVKRTPARRRAWYRDLVETQIQRDVRDVARIHSLDYGDR